MFWVMNAWPLPQTFWTGEGSPWLHCTWHVQVLSHHLPHSWLLARLPLLTLSRRKISQHNTQDAKPAKLEHRAQEPAAQGRSRRATACRALPKCGRNLGSPSQLQFWSQAQPFQQKAYVAPQARLWAFAGQNGTNKPPHSSHQTLPLRFATS